MKQTNLFNVTDSFQLYNSFRTKFQAYSSLKDSGIFYDWSDGKSDAIESESNTCAVFFKSNGLVVPGRWKLTYNQSIFLIAFDNTYIFNHSVLHLIFAIENLV